MLLYAYRFFFYPILKFTFWALSPFSTKVKKGLQLRNPGPNGITPWIRGPQGQRPIWIHCASGEFEYAKPILEVLKHDLPWIKTMVTYFSPTYAEAIEKDQRVDFATPLPWDQPQVVDEFIRHHHPRVLLVARTDLWPELLKAAQNHQVPTLLFAATLSADSVKMTSFLSRIFLKWRLNFLNEIFCVTELDQQSFKSLLLSTPVRVEGDPRYDQVLHRLKNPRKLKDELRPQNGRPVFVCGSTWPEDEHVILKIAGEILKEGFNLILVPHEPSPSHLENIERELKGFKVIRYSQAEAWRTDEILLVDQVGILAELYLWGDIAFVGGSFRRSVHSVMEPFAAGLPVIVGPHYQNNREAQEFMRENNLFIRSVSTSDDFLESLLELKKQLSPELTNKIKNSVTSKAGGSKRVVKWLEPYL